MCGEELGPPGVSCRGHPKRKKLFGVQCSSFGSPLPAPAAPTGPRPYLCDGGGQQGDWASPAPRTSVGPDCEPERGPAVVEGHTSVQRPAGAAELEGWMGWAAGERKCEDEGQRACPGMTVILQLCVRGRGCGNPGTNSPSPLKPSFSSVSEATEKVNTGSGA